MACDSSATCAREAKLRVNRITPAQASCCSQSRSWGVSSVPATPIISISGGLSRLPPLQHGLRGEPGYGFYVGGVGEHVHHAGGLQGPAALVDQVAGVA